MSTALIDLEDRIITDKGTMVAKHSLLVKLALAKEQFKHLPFVSYEDSNLYHQDNPDAKCWEDDGVMGAPRIDSYYWMMPEQYRNINIEEYCFTKMVDMKLDQYRDYLDRLTTELLRVQEKDMYDFIRCLIWITDTLRGNKIVWGVGRGSSCASLIMFLIGVNKVDPVKYDIPMEEFYK